MILGIDEVGRGPWAGPLVVGAVVLGGIEISGLTDSKKLTKKRRIELDAEIRKKASSYGLGWVEAGEIDEIGLSKALVLATKRAVVQIKAPYHEIIIDGTVNFLRDTNKADYVKVLKKADLLIPSVSAASIIAKVARDNFMEQINKIYPDYGFASHVGYGTAKHRQAIEILGVTPLHRLSFKPLLKYLNSSDYEPDSISVDSVITTKAVGDQAEVLVANYLTKKGHKIIDRNWKTRHCEIDIISELDDILYFTEVKYRKNFDQGGGFEAITNQKLNQIKFAIKYYVSVNDIFNTELRIIGASVSGLPMIIDDMVEIQ